MSDSGDAVNYVANGRCEFRVTRNAVITARIFRLGAGDFLDIGPIRYEEPDEVGPNNLPVTRNTPIVFSVDDNSATVAAGFEICIVG